MALIGCSDVTSIILFFSKFVLYLEKKEKSFICFSSNYNVLWIEVIEVKDDEGD